MELDSEELHCAGEREVMMGIDFAVNSRFRGYRLEYASDKVKY